MRVVRMYGLTGPLVLALQDADLEKLAGAREEAFQAWRADLAASGGDRGTCVLGAGLTVPYIPSRKLIARALVVVSPPGQADCSWCRDRAAGILQAALDALPRPTSRVERSRMKVAAEENGVEVEELKPTVGWEWGRMD